MPKRSHPADPYGIEGSLDHQDSPSVTAPTRLNTPSLFEPVLCARDPDGHKGTFGSVAILGGAAGMTGAALLAGRSALKAGTGRVYVSLAQAHPDVVVDYVQPELMLRRAQDMLAIASQMDAWGVGCGMGTSDASARLLDTLFETRGTTPTVIDADALNLLAGRNGPVAWSDSQVVLTPHPAEAARLLKTSTAIVQSDRTGSVRALAKRYKAWVVLKGRHTLIASPEGDLVINPTGSVSLATAGTGDVLTGLIAGLLAQRFTMECAILAAVWLHGAAGEVMCHQLGGPVGVTASDVIEGIRILRNSTSLLAEEIRSFNITANITTAQPQTPT